MKKIILKISIFSILLGSLSSCGDDFLTVNPSDKIPTGQPASEKLLQQYLASAYQILLFDSYANSNYNSYILMGDLRSDDLYKGGGDAADQSPLYHLSQLNSTPSNVPTGWWSIYYAGLGRCNNAINACKNPLPSASESEVNRISAEAHVLRAYYIHSLWKMWGNIPYFEEDLASPFLAKQYTADEIYKEMMEDLDYALDGNKLKSTGLPTTVTKAVAQLLRARIVMYQNDESRFNQVLADMVDITKNTSYGLMATLEDVFVREGELCKESIFETDQRAEGKTWGNAWAGFGTNMPVFISPDGLVDADGVFAGGWGFAPVRTEAYNMYSPDDNRRASSINDFREANYKARFQNTGFFMRKYAARKDYSSGKFGDEPLNFENNLRIFRLPEAYLNAAELVVRGATATGALTAQGYLDFVRKRAFGDNFDKNKVTATFENIKKERRLEFLGEGLRYWDLVRWGDAPTVVTENLPAFSSNRTWDPVKDKYLPIPQGEIDKTSGTGEFELKQNPY